MSLIDREPIDRESYSPPISRSASCSLPRRQATAQHRLRSTVWEARKLNRLSRASVAPYLGGKPYMLQRIARRRKGQWKCGSCTQAHRADEAQLRIQDHERAVRTDGRHARRLAAEFHIPHLLLHGASGGHSDALARQALVMQQANKPVACTSAFAECYTLYMCKVVQLPTTMCIGSQSGA